MNETLQLLRFLLWICLLTAQAYPQFRKSAFDSSRINQPKQALNYLGPITKPIRVEDGSSKLNQFGYDLFIQDELTLSLPGGEALVLPPDYRLGPGDRLGIFLLGKVQENLEVMVNVEGKIFLPPVGVVHIWGLKMDEFKTLLAKKFLRYFDNFEVDIMLLKPKNVLVAIVGDVYRPGKYTLSALNTVLDAVILAGGPTENGSIRDIQLLRNGELAASVDLYKFLISGQNQDDIFLETGDRIYVPLTESKITVEGEIKRPAIFELKPGLDERLSDLIELAGGFTEFAYLDKIEISSLQESGYRKVDYVNFQEIIDGDSTKNRLMRHGDKLRIYSKLEQIHTRTVAIFGEVRRPGRYVLEDDMHLSDFILKAGSLTKNAYTLEAEIAKNDPGKPSVFFKVNLQEMYSGTNGHEDILLEDDDQVFIRQIPEWQVGLIVEVRGELKFPGSYPIVKDSTKLSDILTNAGGFTEEAFLQEAIVLRSSTRIKFDKEFERLSEMRREEMSDLEYQYLVMRQNSADINQIVVNFEKLVYQHDRNQDIILEDGDVIIVPKSPKVVTITGRVGKPGGVTYQPGANLAYYLAKAGGASWDANLSKTKIIKVTGEVVDDEDVKFFEAGDIIWVPRKSDKNAWPIVLQSITVLAQLASIYLIVDTAINR